MTVLRRIFFFLIKNPDVVLPGYVGAVIGLVISALVLEYGFDAKPCQMCWWQRYIHWGIGLAALLGWALRRKISPLISLGSVLLLSLGGMGVAVWQVLVQNKIIAAPQGCASTDFQMTADINAFMTDLKKGLPDMPACDKIDFTIIGHSLAEWNILVMFGFALAAGLVLWYNSTNRDNN